VKRGDQVTVIGGPGVAFAITDMPWDPSNVGMISSIAVPVSILGIYDGLAHGRDFDLPHTHEIMIELADGPVWMPLRREHFEPVR
jgi:hypothetical protein